MTGYVEAAAAGDEGDGHVKMEAPVRKAALAFIFVTVVLDMLALGIIVPVLPMRCCGSKMATADRPYKGSI